MDKKSGENRKLSSKKQHNATISFEIGTVG